MNGNSIKYTEGQVLGDQCIFIRDTYTSCKPRKALFKCRCGNEFEANINSIKKLHTKSCGCVKANFNVKKFTIHGGKGTDEYIIWKAIKSRIFNKKNIQWSIYGGRDIKMHESWVNDFSQFLKDTGFRPSKKHSIDRIDVNGNYEPGNVRYATPKEQQNNKRNNVILELNGECKTMSQWADLYNINQITIAKRIKRGWSIEDAITKPNNTKMK